MPVRSSMSAGCKTSSRIFKRHKVRLAILTQISNSTNSKCNLGTFNITHSSSNNNLLCNNTSILFSITKCCIFNRINTYDSNPHNSNPYRIQQNIKRRNMVKLLNRFNNLSSSYKINNSKIPFSNQHSNHRLRKRNNNRRDKVLS